MHLEYLFGTAMMIVAMTMVFIGIPSQILKNRRERRCGVPLISAALSFLVFFTRIGYAITIDSYYLLIPDCFGIVMACILLWQHWRYRDPTKTRRT